MAFDPSLFKDVADALSIQSPAIVEKDYWAVQLLTLVADCGNDHYDLVFSGGTCLSKAYRNTFRMSEDLDLKLVPKFQPGSISRTKQRALRNQICQKIISVIEANNNFKLAATPLKRNEGCYQTFVISYPTHHQQILALRPHLKLEITESTFVTEPKTNSVQSLYSELLNLDPEISATQCVGLDSIACEKFVALLRRTALVARDSSKPDDERLIRHIYDLHLIDMQDVSAVAQKATLLQVLEIDRKQFGKQHHEFYVSPQKELAFGLEVLSKQEIHKKRYKKFIDPLVYHPNPAGWEDSFASLQRLSNHWLSYE